MHECSTFKDIKSISIYVEYEKLQFFLLNDYLYDEDTGVFYKNLFNALKIGTKNTFKLQAFKLIHFQLLLLF